MTTLYKNYWQIFAVYSNTRSCELPQRKEKQNISVAWNSQSVLHAMNTKQIECSMCQVLTSVTCVFASFPVSLPDFTAIPPEIPSVSVQHLCQAELMLLSKENISRGFSCWLFTSRSQGRPWSSSLSDSQDCFNAFHKFLQPRHWKSTLEIPKGWECAPQIKLGGIKRLVCPTCLPPTMPGRPWTCVLSSLTSKHQEDLLSCFFTLQGGYERAWGAPG